MTEPISGEPASAFRACWDATHARTRSYLARRVVAVDLDDALTETYLVVWRRFADLPVSQDAQQWWILAIARRVAANSRRSAHRRTALKERLTAMFMPTPTPHEPPTDPLVASALASLSSTDREVLVLHAWDELSPEGIASVLGISIAAATKRLQRAKMRFVVEYRAQMSTNTASLDTATGNDTDGVDAIENRGGLT